MTAIGPGDRQSLQYDLLANLDGWWSDDHVWCNEADQECGGIGSIWRNVHDHRCVVGDMQEIEIREVDTESKAGKQS